MDFDISCVESLERPIVFTNGCFDLFHYGHLYSLQQSKKFGKSLVVGINSEKSIKMFKDGDRPIIGDFHRIEIVKALRCVDYAFIFNELTVDKYIKEIIPDYYVKGIEWKDNLPELTDNIEVKFIDRIENLSTSNIVDSLRKS